MDADQRPGPSTLACAALGVAGVGALLGVMHLIAGRSERLGVLHGAAGELQRATEAYDAAFHRLSEAEAALEGVKANAWGEGAGEEDEERWAVEVLPRFRAARSEVHEARAAADAARACMRDWSEVVSLGQRLAQTKAGREADELVRELEEFSLSRRHRS